MRSAGRCKIDVIEWPELQMKEVTHVQEVAVPELRATLGDGAGPVRCRPNAQASISKSKGQMTVILAGDTMTSAASLYTLSYCSRAREGRAVLVQGNKA